MKTKTLDTIQILSKTGKIASKIIYILSLIGGIGCVVGIIGLAIIPNGFKIFGVTIHSIIEKSSDISIGSCYTAMAVGAIFCAGEAVLCKIAGRYFKNELDAGTPFTFDGAKELMRLGIYTICIPIATLALAVIVYEVMQHCFGNVEILDFGNTTSVGLGIMFIIMSLVCKYGAEITNGKEEKSEDKAAEDEK